ncbi:aminoglycoside O-phosphotransferase APH(3')-IIIa [Clostridia bacterium]|nr:aminoglycoside O-phosphotransferase APH(3')-IIIa [Clostridia bacterium]
MDYSIENTLAGYACEQISVGCSTASVYRYTKGAETLYLKTQKDGEEIRREYGVLRWLSGKIPVPSVRFWGERDGLRYLLTTEVPGHMACNCPEDTLREPHENTVKLLAEGILTLQAVDISDCPLVYALGSRLKSALYNIEHNLIDMPDFEYRNPDKTPRELYEYLLQNQPPEELCFCHGDFCLPNVFIDSERVTGYIDMGRGGVSDKWFDIALCVRSLRYNSRHTSAEEYVNLLFEHLNLTPNWDKINYYNLLDELF